MDCVLKQAISPIHKEENPKVLLKAGQVFEEETTYTFEVRK